MNKWVWLPVMAIVAPYAAHAEVYFDVGQAQQAIFPGATFTKAPTTLSDAQAEAIEKRSGVNVRNKEIQVWQASTGGFFFVDEAVGKHEFITLAMGLNADGSFKRIEVMEYKETYGFQVRDADWRQQFVGKTAASSLELGTDIKNISGATLSCKHIADSIKRVLVTLAVLAGK
jgi:Na+-translocating ferredoxin:NAD+ oxidoreductase RnfG subunit